MRVFAILFFLAVVLFAHQKPVSKFVASGRVVDLAYSSNHIFAATDAGVVDVFDYKTKKSIEKIKFDKIKDFAGDKANAKIYSVDVYGDSLLILVQGEGGFGEVYMYEKNRLQKIISISKQLAIAKAAFVDKENILLGLLSDELVSYNIKNAKQNYIVQVSGGRFSDFALNESRSEVVVVDEGGVPQIHNTKTGRVVKKLSNSNLDNIFQVDYRAGVVATAGQDRKMIVYNLKKNSSYFVKSTFLVYAVGISPDGSKVAYSSDEENIISLYDNSTTRLMGSFSGTKMIPSKILFINENEFLVASDDKVINLYNIKK